MVRPGGRDHLQVRRSEVHGARRLVRGRPRGIPHAHKSVGPKPARFIAIVSPPGFEGFFGEQTKLRAAGVNSEDFAALAKRYGVKELEPVDWS